MQPVEARAPMTLARALRHYPRRWLTRDVVAGVAVAGMLVPQGMAYGQLAGLPPVTGLYAALGAMIAFALLSRTPRVIMGPDGATAALCAATIGPVAAGDPARALALAALLAILVGGFLVLAGLLRIGFLAEFLSRPVLAGYMMGLALTIIAGQLPRLFGFSVDGKDIFTVVVNIVRDLGHTQVTTLALGLALLVLSLVLARLAPRAPAALAVLVVGTAASAALDLSAHGVAVVGAVPAGLPSLSLPDVGIADARELITPACAIAMLVFADGVATARAFAVRHGETVDANRECLALGVGNLGAALTGGFTCSASGSRTAVNDGAGTRSQVSQLVAAAGVVITLLLFTSLLTELPLAALAAIVIAACTRLFDFGELRSLWRQWRSEAVLAVVTLIGVALLGVLAGLGLAVVLALVNLVYRNAFPHDAVLARDGEAGAFRDAEELEAPVTVPGLVIYRFDAPLFFANATRFEARIRELVGEPSVRGLLLDCEAIFYIDSTAIAMLQRLRVDLRDRGVWLGVARMKSPVRAMIARPLRGPVDRERLFPTMRAAVAAYEHDASVLAPR